MTRSTEMMDHEATEWWDSFASHYIAEFVPRFQSLYNKLETYVPSTAKDVLCYGEGPGEPSLTIGGKRRLNLTVMDGSSEMVEIARKRFAERDVEASLLAESSVSGFQPNSFDVVVSSLCFMYLPQDKLGKFLTELGEKVKTNGLLITSHWAHPSKVALLRLFKAGCLTGNFLKNPKPNLTFSLAENSEVDYDEMAKSGPFSLSDMTNYEKALKYAGFKIQRIENLSLPMEFSDESELDSFLKAFYNETLTDEISKCIKDIIQAYLEENGLSSDLSRSFRLPSECVIVVSRKR